MKISLTILFAMFSMSLFSQETALKPAIRNAMYAQASIADGIVGINYERKVITNFVSLWVRSGLLINTNGRFGIPIEINSVFGKQSNHAEIGINYSQFFSKYNSPVLVGGKIGYRYQHFEKSGLIFKLGLEFYNISEQHDDYRTRKPQQSLYIALGYGF